MNFSKHLVLYALSVAKPRGLGSSYGLINHRRFPYHQISEFTNDSKNSQMETLQDTKILEDLPLSKYLHERRMANLMRYGAEMSRLDQQKTERLNKACKEQHEKFIKDIRKLTADMRATNQAITRWGRATAVLTPIFLYVLCLAPLFYNEDYTDL